MKIGIFSDAHGSMAAVEQVYALAPDCALWLYAGDVASDAHYLETLVGAGATIRFVPGNCDWPNANTPETIVVEAAGHRLLLTHGHVYGVQYGTRFLVEAAAEANCDIAVYGHTHVVEYTPGTPITVLNPGSAARPRDGAFGSFMTVDLLPGKAPSVHVHRLGQK